ncbi:MAG: DUF1330 domain-containing protein, partial [Alphaproteobacteria bacterium]
MAAYVFVNISVTDPDAFQAYRDAVSSNIMAFGGSYVVRGGVAEVLEGRHDGSERVLLMVPTLDQAKRWWNSPEYAEIKKLRKGSAK